MPVCRRDRIIVERSSNPRAAACRVKTLASAGVRDSPAACRGNGAPPKLCRHVLTSEVSSELPSGTPMPQLHRAIVDHVNVYLAALVIAAAYWLGTQVGLLLTPTGLAFS